MASLFIYENKYKYLKYIEDKIWNYNFFCPKTQYFVQKKYFDLRKFVHIRT